MSYIVTPFTTWFALLSLIAVHLFLNYRGVNVVSMRTLNRHRANIVFEALCERRVVLSPSDVSRMENIFG